MAICTGETTLLKLVLSDRGGCVCVCVCVCVGGGGGGSTVTLEVVGHLISLSYLSLNLK